MMRAKGDNEGGHPPIIVVRRRSGGDDGGHHGGVWKIAYADFMTAMMAFFLVMWLINATDEKTIVQVAAYFNPIRLSDKTPSNRGLHDGTQNPRESASKVGEADSPNGDRNRNGPDGGTQSEPKPLSKKQARRKAEQERELFEEPQKTLDRIADGQSRQSPINTVVDSSPKVPSDPAPLLDPFAPRAEPKSTPRLAATPTTPGNDKGASATKSASAENKEARSDGAALHSLAAAVEQLAQVFLGPKPRIEVSLVPEGVLISLSDAAEFGMFAVGSAEPRSEMVDLMTRIGRILSGTEWPIIVRGHTDSRPYRSPTYDNWRLSSARAHMAHYMLLRGGVNEKRVVRVEGHADRMPKNEADTGAAENRRIDIIIRKGAS